jgi:hypothetical protein
MDTGLPGHLRRCPFGILNPALQLHTAGSFQATKRIERSSGQIKK